VAAAEYFLARRIISLGQHCVVDGDPRRAQVIHSAPEGSSRFGGSTRWVPGQRLWMNLWKLWIAPTLLDRDLNVMWAGAATLVG
jgi:hypothetical protein